MTELLVRKTFAVLVVMALVLSLGVVTGTPVLAAPGATYYVCVTGDDTTGDGSEGSPWVTIQHAVNEVDPGDTIIVCPGDYNEDVTIEKSLTLKSQGGSDVTTIQGTITVDLVDGQEVVFGGVGSGFTVTAGGDSRGIDARVEYWSSLSIVGNTFTGNEHGIYVNHVRYFSHADISGNAISGNTGTGIDLPGGPAVRYHSSLAIVANQITDNGDRGIYWNDIRDNSHGLVQGNTIARNVGDGFWFDDVEHGSSLDIIDNQVTDNGGWGVRISDYDEGCQGLIQGNTITRNGSDGLYFSSDVEEGSHVTIHDNTVTYNGGWGVRVDDVEYGSYLAILENRITDNTSGGIYINRYEDGGEGLIQSNTITSNNVYGIYIRSRVDDGSSLTIAGNTISNTRSIEIAAEAVGTGDGSSTYFYLSNDDVIPGSETIYLDGEPTTAYTIYYEYGDIDFDTAPGSGVVITADYEFGGFGINIGGGVEDGSYLVIEANQITNNANSGIYIQEIDEGSRAIIEGNNISGSGANGIEIGMGYDDGEGDYWYYSVNRGSSLAILNNVVENSTADGIYIAAIERGGEVLIQGNAVSSNNYGVYVEMMSEGGKLDIVDNAITGHASGGVYAGSTVQDSEVNVLENDISDNTGIGLHIGGIMDTLTDSTATVRCNTISGNTEWGIYLFASHSLVDISGNHILNNGTGTDKGGIYVDGSELDFVGIHRNRIEGNDEWGLLNDSGEEIDATYNWWGDASGPEPEGSGDKVSNEVDYLDWLAASPALCAEHVPPATTPNIHEVEDGDSIQAAIDSADPGDIISVGPGTYSENLTIDKSLTVLSTGGADSTTIDGTVTIDLIDAQTVAFGGAGSGFTVPGDSPGFDVIVRFWSRLTIQGNTIIGCTGDGIRVDGVTHWSSLSILGNEIDGNGADGIYIEYVWYFSQIEISGNDVSDNASHGMHLYGFDDEWDDSDYAVRYHSSLAIVANQITDNGDRGIHWNDIRDNSHGLVQGNTIARNVGDGFWFDDVEHGSSLDIIDNQVTDNGGWGVRIDNYDEGSQGLIQGNTIARNGSDGLRFNNDVEEGSHVTIDDNTITDNGGWGIRVDDVEDGAYLAILENRITGNASGGIRIYEYDDGSEGLIQGNTITDNYGWGIYIRSGVEDGSSLTIAGNTISNTRSIEVADEYVGTGDDSRVYFYLDNNDVVPGSETIYLDGVPTTAYTIYYEYGDIDFDTAPASGVVITADYEFGGYGIYIDDGVKDGSYLVIEANQITNNANSGIYIEEIDEGGRAIIEANTISGNLHGIYVDQDIDEGGYLAVLDNVIVGNAGDGIYIEDIERGSETLIEGNSISGNDYGVYVEEMSAGGMLTVDGNDISQNAGVGLWLGGHADTLENSMVSILSNTISQNAGWGIYGYVVHSMVDVSHCNRILNNAGGGMYIDGSGLYLVAINSNDIYGNNGYGLLNDSSEDVEATFNWWGAVSGPAPIGSGDTVSDNVIYDPWSTSSCQPPPVGPPVGGTAHPVNRLVLLTPWIILGAAIIMGTGLLALRHRRAQS